MNEFLIKLISNGGKGSGNFTPGQGRGIGKPGSSSGMSGKSSKKETVDSIKAFEDISDYLGNRSKAKSLLKEYQSDDQGAIDKLAEYTGSRRVVKRLLEAAKDY